MSNEFDGTIRRPLHLRISGAARSRAAWVQLLRFALVGASGAVVNLVVFAIVTSLGADYRVAAVVGFAVAVTHNFLLNRVWTFQESAPNAGHTGFQAARFLTVSLVGLGVNLVVLHFLVAAGAGELPGQAAAIAAATPVGFVGNKLWSFGRR